MKHCSFMGCVESLIYKYLQGPWSGILRGGVIVQEALGAGRCEVVAANDCIFNLRFWYVDESVSADIIFYLLRPLRRHLHIFRAEHSHHDFFHLKSVFLHVPYETALLNAQVNRRSCSLLPLLRRIRFEDVLIPDAAESHIFLNDAALVLPVNDPCLKFRLVRIAAEEFLIQGENILLDLLLARIVP